MFSQVCLILNVDGYPVDGRFQCRELAYDLPGKNLTASSVSFVVDLPTQPNEVRQGEFLFRSLHGLPVKGGQYAQTMLPFILQDLYSTHKSKKRPLVAIKGNQHAQALLEGLKIPFMDLEKRGCPRYECLSKPDDVLTCGEHKNERRCGRSMVAAYRRWMMMA